MLRVHFDEGSSKLQLLNDETKDHSYSLRNVSKEFISKINLLRTDVSELYTILYGISRKVEDEKLHAIGLQNKISNIQEAKKQKVFLINIKLQEKEMQLKRHVNTTESLQRMIAEQTNTIEKLSYTQ